MESKWLSIIVPKLVGKAYKVYASADKESSYEMIKTTILRVYSVIPDSYRQQFRNLKKAFDQIFTEFAQGSNILFKKWLEVTETKTFDDLINLVVFEQFKSKLPFFILRHRGLEGEGYGEGSRFGGRTLLIGAVAQQCK